MKDEMMNERREWFTKELAQGSDFPEDLTGFYLMKNPPPVVEGEDDDGGGKGKDKKKDKKKDDKKEDNFAQKYDMGMVKGVVRPKVYKELTKVVDTMLLDQLKNLQLQLAAASKSYHR